MVTPGRGDARGGPGDPPIGRPGGAEVEREAAPRHDQEVTVLVALEDGDVEAVLLEEPGRGEPDHPGSDDGDVLWHAIQLSGWEWSATTQREHPAQVTSQGWPTSRSGSIAVLQAAQRP